MIAVTGLRTTIVRQLGLLIDEQIVPILGDLSCPDAPLRLPAAGRFVLAAGVIQGMPILAQSAAQIIETLAVNLVNAVRICETALNESPSARVCVIGSWSGIHGSYDLTYALSKAALHRYVQMRAVGAAQQLVCLAPPIIADAGMTSRRHDYPQVLDARPHVTARAVAEAIRWELYERPPGGNYVRVLEP